MNRHARAAVAWRRRYAEWLAFAEGRDGTDAGGEARELKPTSGIVLVTNALTAGVGGAFGNAPLGRDVRIATGADRAPSGLARHGRYVGRGGGIVAEADPI